MKPKSRNVVIVCAVILAVCLVVFAVSTVIQIVHNGWDAFSVVNLVPFFGMVAVMIVILTGGKNKDGK